MRRRRQCHLAPHLVFLAGKNRGGGGTVDCRGRLVRSGSDRADGRNDQTGLRRPSVVGIGRRAHIACIQFVNLEPVPAHHYRLLTLLLDNLANLKDKTYTFTYLLHENKGSFVQHWLILASVHEPNSAQLYKGSIRKGVNLPGSSVLWVRG